MDTCRGCVARRPPPAVIVEMRRRTRNGLDPWLSSEPGLIATQVLTLAPIVVRSKMPANASSMRRCLVAKTAAKKLRKVILKSRRRHAQVTPRHHAEPNKGLVPFHPRSRWGWTRPDDRQGDCRGLAIITANRGAAALPTVHGPTIPCMICLVHHLHPANKNRFPGLSSPIPGEKIPRSARERRTDAEHSSWPEHRYGLTRDDPAPEPVRGRGQVHRAGSEGHSEGWRNLRRRRAE